MRAPPRTARGKPRQTNVFVEKRSKHRSQLLYFIIFLDGKYDKCGARRGDADRFFSGSACGSGSPHSSRPPAACSVCSGRSCRSCQAPGLAAAAAAAFYRSQKWPAPIFRPHQAAPLNFPALARVMYARCSNGLPRATGTEGGGGGEELAVGSGAVAPITCHLGGHFSRGCWLHAPRPPSLAGPGHIARIGRGADRGRLAQRPTRAPRYSTAQPAGRLVVAWFGVKLLSNCCLHR